MKTEREMKKERKKVKITKQNGLKDVEDKE